MHEWKAGIVLCQSNAPSDDDITLIRKETKEISLIAIVVKLTLTLFLKLILYYIYFANFAI